MEQNEEVFISYSYDDEKHIEAVLHLSNKLRAEGIDCVLDQYETSPKEGWPMWMDRQIQKAKYVLLVCTETYNKRVMGDELEGQGNGVKWEGKLIYQYLYEDGPNNNRFIPIVFRHEDYQYIPTPLRGSTPYNIETEKGYEDLYRHLTGQPSAAKPKLGKRRALPKRPVKTNPAMFIASPIDINLWNQAKWRATFVVTHDGAPPVLGLGFRNEKAAREIFKGWHERYGENDEYEELRIAIIEGDIAGEDKGYSVHVCLDPETAVERYRSAGYEFDEGLMMTVSRINRMNPSPSSNSLEMFKASFRKHKVYYIVPGILAENDQDIKPLFELGILKSKIVFRKTEDIHENDIDFVVIDPKAKF